MRMRRFVLSVVAVLCALTIAAHFTPSAYAEETSTGSSDGTAFVAGDINGDGGVDNKDLTRLFQYLSDWDVEVVEGNLDTNGDGSVNNKDLTRLFQYLSDWDVEIHGGPGTNPDPDPDPHDDPDPQPGEGIVATSFVYGYSEMGRELVCHSIAPASYSKTVLLEFEIHGFEDEYDHDGQVLVDTANSLIEHYSAAEDLNETRLLIIPSANPDGLLDGDSNQGFGRCNAKGIDLNRDFDANYQANLSMGRNYTPYAFSGAESRALRDLCLEYSPDIVIDFHGWENSLIGDIELCVPFHEEMGLNQTHSYGANNCRGYFSNWAHQQGALAMLVEFPSSTGIEMDRLINAIDRLINDQYDKGVATGDYGVLEGKKTVFMCPSRIDLAENHYIANGDICYISDFDLETGMCSVVYPNGGSNVFASGQATLDAEISIKSILGGNNGFASTAETAGDSNVKVYPTSALETLGTNWYIDAGGKYYTLNETSDATAVLYYCATGAHAGYWKIGWMEKVGV